ncbi:MAG: hypothetical protein K1X78_20290 [Verrucomicrobiaceae bacterium]|nr:hypothetical protein [Verrucomicrobiaceae bacterium]
MTNYIIKKQAILDCAEARKLQVLEREREQLMKRNLLTRSRSLPPMLNTSVAVTQFQNGSAPVTKILPIALMAKWAKLTQQDDIGIGFTSQGVLLECGGRTFARVHFFEPQRIGDRHPFQFADVGDTIRLVAGKDTFELETPPDAKRIKHLRQQVGQARKRAAMEKKFAKARAALLMVHAQCRAESGQVRKARKLLGAIPLPVALSIAQRVRSTRRFIRATLKAPFVVPSWVKTADHISSIQQALDGLHEAQQARDSYKPRNRRHKQMGRGVKWRKLQAAVELEERKVLGSLEQALRVHLASQGWHANACHALISWTPGWRSHLCNYSRARVSVRRWKDNRRKLKERFNDAFHHAQDALQKLKHA